MPDAMDDPTTPLHKARALKAAYRELFGQLLTEPMTVRELAGYWGEISPAIMRRILQGMVDAVQLPAARGGPGKLWRVPIVKMPPRYLLRIGLLKPQEFPADNKRQHSATDAESRWTPGRKAA